MIQISLSRATVEPDCLSLVHHYNDIEPSVGPNAARPGLYWRSEYPLGHSLMAP